MTAAVMEHTEIVQLVCEGRCNAGRVAAYDALVRASRVQGTPVLSDTIIALGRSLRHTAHRRVGIDYVCALCGTYRRCA